MHTGHHYEDYKLIIGWKAINVNDSKLGRKRKLRELLRTYQHGTSLDNKPMFKEFKSELEK
jgi:hypothetical protein